MWKLDLIVSVIFLISIPIVFYKFRKQTIYIFSILILSKIIFSIGLDYIEYKKNYTNLYSNYVIDADGYTNLARKYLKIKSHNRSKNKNYLDTEKSYLISSLKDKYVLIDNPKKKLQLLDKQFNFITKKDLENHVSALNSSENKIFLGHQEGNISVFKIEDDKDLLRIKKYQFDRKETITAVKYKDNNIFFGTINGNVGKIYEDNIYNLDDKHITKVNQIKIYNNEIYTSSLDGTIRKIKNNKLNKIFINDKKISDFHIDENNLYISRFAGKLLKCDLNNIQKCIPYGDNLNFISKIFSDGKNFILGDIYGGIFLLEKNNIHYLNNPKKNLKGYFANHSAAINFLDFNNYTQKLFTFSEDGKLIKQSLDSKIELKKNIFDTNKRKVLGLFNDDFRLPGYPLLIALSMKTLSIYDATSIIIFQKIIFSIFVVSILVIFKKKMNFISQTIYTSFICLPFSTVLAFAANDLTEIILFIFFSLFIFSEIFIKKKSYILIVQFIIILFCSFVKSTFAIIVILWFLSKFILQLFYKKQIRIYNLLTLFFTVVLFLFVNNQFKEQSNYNAKILPSYISSVLSDKDDYVNLGQNNYTNFIDEVNELISDRQLRQNYIINMLSDVDYYVNEISYNNKKFSNEELSKVSINLLISNPMKYITYNLKNKIFLIKEFHLFPGDFGNHYFRDKGYLIIHYIILIFSILTLILFFYGILSLFKNDKFLATHFIVFLTSYILFYILLHDTFNQRYFFPSGCIYYFYIIYGSNEFLMKFNFFRRQLG